MLVSLTMEKQTLSKKNIYLRDGFLGPGRNPSHFSGHALKWLVSMVPMVSVLTGFNCNNFSC